MTFVAARTTGHLATVVMPDAFALLAYVTAWFFFSRYAEHGRTRDIVGYALAGTLALLVKPTTAHLAISSVALLFLSARFRLRDYRVWAAWLLMVGTLALYLAQAHNLYLVYGNTFGLLSGEDSKVPNLRQLLVPQNYLNAARLAVNWSLTPLAAIVIGVQALRRKLYSHEVALAVGNVAIVFVALRYMSEGAGVHYFAPASLLAASVIASVSAEITSRRTALRRIAVPALAVTTMFELYRNMAIRQFDALYFETEPTIARVIAAGVLVDRMTDRGDLIVARSPKAAYDTTWEQAVNYHDPRIFFISGTRGWTLGKEQAGVDVIASAAAHGARLFVDPFDERFPELEQWLQLHATPVTTGRDIQIWRLSAPGSPVSPTR